MAGITKARYNQIQEAAMKLVASYGIKKLDDTNNPARLQIFRGFAAQLEAEFGIGRDAARGHVAKACRRQRNPAWNEPDWNESGDEPAEWGGRRDGAGR